MLLGRGRGAGDWLDTGAMLLMHGAVLATECKMPGMSMAGARR